MSKVLLSLATLMTISCLTINQCYADFRVATVDVNKVLNDSKEAQAKRKKLDEMSLEVRKKVENKRASLKDIEDKLKGGKLGEDSKEADQYRSQMKDLERMVKDSQEDLKREFLKSNKELTEKALGLIKSYATQNKIDVIFDKSDSSRGAVIFAGNITDITENIVKDMNK